MDCKDGYAYSIINKNCINCTTYDQNCNKCDENRCVSCTKGYYLDLGRCLSCPKNCVECMASVCITCDRGAYNNPSNPSECISCSTSLPHCTDCTAKDGMKCLQCEDSYFLNVDRCYPCSQKFLEFDSTCYKCNFNGCTGCKSSYFLNGTLCSSCSKRFSLCQDCTE